MINYQKGNSNNLTLGRGELLFAGYAANSEKPTNFRFLGNAPTFSLNVTSETLDHYSSTSGIRNLDASVPLQTDRTGELVLEDISPENLAFFLQGSSEEVTSSSGTMTVTIEDVQLGGVYQLGVSESLPQGVRNIMATGFEVNDGAQSNPVVYNQGTHYNVDLVEGMIEIINPQPATTPIAGGDTLTVEFELDTAKKYQQIISGSTPIVGALIFREVNAVGANCKVYIPKAELSANGNMEFIGDSWKQIPLSLKALVPAGGGEAVYLNGAPYTP